MSKLIKILLILGLIQATFLLAGLIVYLLISPDISGTMAQHSGYVVADADGDGADDLILMHDEVRHELNGPGTRRVTVTAYSGRTFKPLWTAPLPHNLDGQYSGTIKLELRGGALLQHWYTGVGFLDLKTQETGFASHEGLLDEPCLGPRGLQARSREHAGPTLWADPATRTLQPTQDLCVYGDPADALALKARCAALGAACEGAVLELPKLTPLQAAARAQRGGRQTTLPDRLIWRAGEARVKVDNGALVGQVGESERWRRALGAQDDWTVAGERVLVVDHATRALVALDATSGKQRWTFAERPYTLYGVDAVGEHALVRASKPGARPGRAKHGLLVVRLKDGALVEGWDRSAEQPAWSPSGLAELWRRWRALKQ